MKIIARRGLPSKNAPEDTRDAIILALNSEAVSGISLELGLTHDLEIVIAPCRNIDCITYFQEDIENYTLDEIKPYNIGTKIHNQQINELTDILDIYPPNKILLLNVPAKESRNIPFVLKLKNILSNYPDRQIYLTSTLKEMVLLLQQEIKGFKIGQNIIARSQLNNELETDFYTLTDCCFEGDLIKRIIDANKEVFVFPVNNIKQINNLKNNLKESFKEIYIMTNNVVLVSNYLSLQEKNY